MVICFCQSMRGLAQVIKTPSEIIERSEAGRCPPDHLRMLQGNLQKPSRSQEGIMADVICGVSGSGLCLRGEGFEIIATQTEVAETVSP